MSIQALTWALDQSCVTATEKAVLLVLANYVGAKGATFVGQETIAKQACCSVKTVERTLAGFEELGLIRRERRHRKDGSRTSDMVFLIGPNHPEKDDENLPDTVSVRGSPNRHPVQTKQTSCPNLPDTVSGLTTFEPLEEPLDELGSNAREENFDRFWSAYPVKKSKPTAMKAFAKAASKTGVDVMIEAVERQKNWRQWREGFVPHAATWLNQERWNDEPSGNDDNGFFRHGSGRRPSSPAERLDAMREGAMAALDEYRRERGGGYEAD